MPRWKGWSIENGDPTDSLIVGGGRGCSLHEGDDVRLLGEIRPDGRGADAVPPFELVRELAQPLLAPGREHDVRARLRERVRELDAEAGGSSVTTATRPRGHTGSQRTKAGGRHRGANGSPRPGQPPHALPPPATATFFRNSGTISLP